MKKPNRLGTRAGVTLVELMISVAILSIAVLGSVGSFQYITKALSHTRARTLATNLAQEKIEMLKDIPYYALLVTTASATDTSISPSIQYDPNNYPQETIVIGGITFVRESYITMQYMLNNQATYTSQTFPDTGLKEITVNVLWNENGVRQIRSLNNLLENPNVNPLDSSFSGTVTNASGGGAISGTTVKVAENQSWSAITDAGGYYNFRVYHGTYTLQFSSAGFSSYTSPVTVANSGSNQTINATLTAIATGTISGIVWYNPDLVISQIVVDTNTAAGDGATHHVQYVELFNPTTYPINIGSNSPNGCTPSTCISSTCNRCLNYWSPATPCASGACGPPYDHPNTDFNLYYVSTYVAPGKYYLTSNATAFYVIGTLRVADAYYNGATCALYSNCTANPANGGGSIEIKDAGGNSIDLVGWTSTSGASGKSKKHPGGGGFGSNNQMVRFSSLTVLSSSLGRAYNSGDNSVDFSTMVPATIQYLPYTTNDAAQPVFAGVPAIGAYVAVSNDPVSGSTQAYTSYTSTTIINGNPYYQPYALFQLTGVSTGTWTVSIGSQTYFQQVQGVAVTQGVNTWIPTAVTTPSWPLSGNYSAFLTSSTSNGYIKGQITDAYGNNLNGIAVTAPGMSKTTNSNGIYFGTIPSTGPVNVVANASGSSFNASYVQQTSLINVYTAQISSQNFILPQGGKITGYVTSGTTPLPDIVISALLGGTPYGSATSDTTGVFSMLIATGSYTVQPTLDPGQSFSPSAPTASVGVAATVNVGTFTITGAFGSLQGNVTYNGAAMTSGALIIASQASIPSTPPAIYASSAPAQTVLYAVSSKADGTYLLQARGGSGYYLSVYVPTINGTTVSMSTKAYTGVTFTAGSVTSYNLSIP